MVFRKHYKICFSVILQVKKEKPKIDFDRCKKIFVRYCKLLLNRGCGLFVINLNFHVPVFQLFPQLNYKLERLAVSPKCMTLLVITQAHK